MGKSAKAKKEKKKDFQKAKLKVGKTKAKASNATDTSFKARCKNTIIDDESFYLAHMFRSNIGTATIPDGKCSVNINAVHAPPQFA
jgi:hypothetical protein